MPLRVTYYPQLDDSQSADLDKLYGKQAQWPVLLPDARTKLNALLQDDAGAYRFYGGVFNGHLVASALVLAIEGLASFDFLCVRESTRRRGVGSTLLDEIKRFEAARQVHALSCLVDPADEIALAFLRRNHFVLHHEQPVAGKLQLVCELDPL